VYLVDVYGRGMTTEPEVPVLEEINERYRAFHALRGNDLRTGLHLGEWVRAAGLELVDFRGTYQIVTFPPGLRPPALAAREAMLTAGVVTEADLDRWERELSAVDAKPVRPPVPRRPVEPPAARSGRAARQLRLPAPRSGCRPLDQAAGRSIRLPAARSGCRLLGQAVEHVLGDGQAGGGRG